jgi:pyruvate formate lyase activating enzyme
MLASYGKVTRQTVDRLERRGLFHFLPGRMALAVGSAGCNLTCEHCLNWRVSQAEVPFEVVPPGLLVERALAAGVPAIAFTYNEPIIGIEYVLDVARAARTRGLAVALKTNGYIEPDPLTDLLAAVDALNIDLKAIDDAFYDRVCGARLAPVLETLRRCAREVHLEVTWLAIPGGNDAEPEGEAAAAWIAGNLGRGTPVHLPAYLPRRRGTAPPPSVEVLLRVRASFRRHLDHVYFDRDYVPGARDTRCASCGAVLVQRAGDRTATVGLDAQAACVSCRARSGVRL